MYQNYYFPGGNQDLKSHNVSRREKGNSLNQSSSRTFDNGIFRAPKGTLFL